MTFLGILLLYKDRTDRTPVLTHSYNILDVRCDFTMN